MLTIIFLLFILWKLLPLIGEIINDRELRTIAILFFVGWMNYVLWKDGLDIGLLPLSSLLLVFAYISWKK
jgi:hypothetical protein